MKRIDKILLELGFADTIEKAQSLVMSGAVLVDDRPVTKSGELVGENSNIRLKGKSIPYVSRGGLKLAHALDFFSIDPDGLICMDVGASTGGFTDLLLKRGAKKIYAVDVGYGQLAWELRRDKRVVVLERTNIRKLDHSLIKEKINMVVLDLSFISLRVVFPVIDDFLDKNGKVIALIKPQFEVEKEKVEKGGIVKDERFRLEAVDDIKKAGESLGWKCAGVTESPILGAKGNKEFLICFNL